MATVIINGKVLSDKSVEVEIVDKPELLRRLRAHNNPNNEPTGHYTGRCRKCGSTDLWDDNFHYGCNTCGACLT